MQESTYEFCFHFNIPDEDTIHRINAILAAQKYSRLKISQVKPTLVTKTGHKPDGTVNYTSRVPGIMDIAFTGEMEKGHDGYEYRMQVTFFAKGRDRGLEEFLDRWKKLHVYSTLRQLIPVDFKEGRVYIALYHDGEADVEEPVMLKAADDIWSVIYEDHDF